MAFHAERAIGQAGFRAYMLLTHPDVISAVS
jgi:hypothetical protein